MAEGSTTPTNLSPPLRAAAAELRQLQEALRQPMTEERELEAVWSRLVALQRQLPSVEASLTQPEEVPLFERCAATVGGLIDAVGPAREERQATRALKSAIETFEKEVNRPSATVATAPEAARLLGLLEQIRWKVDAIPTGDDPDGPRAQALSSLLTAMDFARQKLEGRSAELANQNDVDAAKRTLRRIVDASVDFDDAESVAKTLSRLDALESALKAPMEGATSEGEMPRVILEVQTVRTQIREIAEGREAARVIRNSIHGYNAAARTFERGPMTPEMATNLRVHFSEIASGLKAVSGNVMPEELKAQHAQIGEAVAALIRQLSV